LVSPEPERVGLAVRVNPHKIQPSSSHEAG
jgi:hypothetical protein